jgi:hypothetical protein
MLLQLTASAAISCTTDMRRRARTGASMTDKSAEGQAAIDVGLELFELLKPLNTNQRAWAVAVAMAECTHADPAFVQRVAYMLEEALRS